MEGCGGRPGWLKGVWWETWMSGGGVVGVVGDLDEWRGCGGRPG